MKMASLVCLVIVVAAAGCSGPAPPQGRKLLVEAQNGLMRRDYQTTMSRTNRFLREYGGTYEAGRAYYLRGKARLALNDIRGALEDLQEAVDHSGGGDVRANARLALGDLAFDRGDMPQAEELFSDAISDIEVGKPPRDHAHYRLGCVLQRKRQWRKAELQFRQVVEYFGGSEFARRSSRRVNATAWTVQAGAFAGRPGANSLAKELRSGGLAADVIPVLSGGRPLFVVVVGRYKTYEQAVKSLNGVRKHQTGAFVTVR